MIFSKWILDSLSSGILNSNAQCSGLHKQKFPGFRNSDYLTWGDMWNPMTPFYLVSLWPDDRTTSQAVSQDWCGQVAWFVILIPWDKLIHKAPVLTCSSVYTKRFYELWRCAALSSIFKSSFSSNAICIVMVKWIFFFCFVSFGGSTSPILSSVGQVSFPKQFPGITKDFLWHDWQTAPEMKRKVRKWDATRSLLAYQGGKNLHTYSMIIIMFLYYTFMRAKCSMETKQVKSILDLVDHVLNSINLVWRKHFNCWYLDL